MSRKQMFDPENDGQAKASLSNTNTSFAAVGRSLERQSVRYLAMHAEGRQRMVTDGEAVQGQGRSRSHGPAARTLLGSAQDAP